MGEETIKQQKFLTGKRHRNFWGEHQKDVEWLEHLKGDFEYKEEQEDVELTPEKIMKILRKMPN